MKLIIQIEIANEVVRETLVFVFEQMLESIIATHALIKRRALVQSARAY